MREWLETYETWLWALSVFGGVAFLGTLVAIPVLVVRIPADYFVRKPVTEWPTRHPVVHLSLIIAKNIFGYALVLAGLAMLVLPGQGLLTILIGIMFLDFPGKRRLERWLIHYKPLRHAADWIRAKRHRPPLELPGLDEEG